MTPASAVTLHQAFQFGIFGASSLAASFLYFREEAKLLAQLAAQPKVDTTGGATPDVTPTNDAGNGNDVDNNQQ